jgi:hypothetical protein
MTLLVATTARLLAVDPATGTVRPAVELTDTKLTCLAASPLSPTRQ